MQVEVEATPRGVCDSVRHEGRIARLSSAAAAVIALFTAGAANAQTVQFTNVSTAAGIAGNIYSSPSEHSLGVNWIDIDNDSWPDLFAVNGLDLEPKLYRNNGDGTFDDSPELLPALPNYDMTGSIFADYDNDGDDDLYIYTDNEDFNLLGANTFDGPPNLLLKNLFVENGNVIIDGVPLFEEVAVAAGVDVLATVPFGDYTGMRAKAAGFLDYDRDGCIDLYVGHLVFQSSGEEGNRDRIYRNNCDGTFSDVTDASGIYPTSGPTDTTYRPTLAMTAGLFNRDMWPDLYIVNASPAVPGAFIPEGHLDRLLVNNRDGTFTEIAFPGVGDDAQAGMGIDFADVDLDGDFDLYITDLFTHNNELEGGVGNPLYPNLGSSLGENAAAAAGVEGADSWGTNFFDADNDGDEDLFVATFSSDTGLSLLYQNDGTGTFTDVSGDAQLFTGSGRGSATADYDQDGDIDLAVVNQKGTLQLFRNDTVGAGNWVQVKLRGVASNASVIGALVRIEVDGVSQVRQVKGGSSAHSQDSLTVHFGVGDATTIDTAVVRWPSGGRTVLNDLAVNQFYDFIEP